VSYHDLYPPRDQDPIGSGRILVVDDEAFFAEALAGMLEDEGFDVVGIASNGAEAVDAVRNLTPYAVLMDLKMPVMDGIEAARVIAAESPFVQILMLSAYEETALREEAAANGVYCYLVKGCRPEFLIEMVRKALSHRENQLRRIALDQ
jgi:DNA-binding NarL/FixJ family response regulator